MADDLGRFIDNQELIIFMQDPTAEIGRIDERHVRPLRTRRPSAGPRPAPWLFARG
jgi:hypothetical protein